MGHQFSNDLFDQTSFNLYDTLKTNQERADACRTALNQAHATLFVAVGIRFNKKDGTGLPIVTGAQWLTVEQTIQLLEAAILSIKSPPNLEQLGKGGEHGPV